MECFVCGKMPVRDNVSMVPIDPKGTKGRRWACLEHAPQDFHMDKETKDLCTILDPKFETIKTN